MNIYYIHNPRFPTDLKAMTYFLIENKSKQLIT